MISIKPLSSIEDTKLVDDIKHNYKIELEGLAEDHIMIMYDNSEFMAISVFDTENTIGIIKFQDYSKSCDNYLMRDGMVKATLNAIYIKGYLDAYLLSSNKDLAVNKQIGLGECEDEVMKKKYSTDNILYAKLPDFFEKGCHSKKKEKS